MKKIIFLDFDGVLNTEHYQNYLMYERKPWQDKHGDFFDPEAVRQLKRIVDVTNVLKTDDIHPPKTGISVHFSCSLPYWRCKISHFSLIRCIFDCFFDVKRILSVRSAHLCVPNGPGLHQRQWCFPSSHRTSPIPVSAR